MARWGRAIGTASGRGYLVAGLQDRGYSDADIRKILGANLLRAWRAVEAAAAAPASTRP